MADFPLFIVHLAVHVSPIIYNYLHLNEAQTVSDASCAQMPEISIWSALHFLSSLYTQLEASHEMLRLILGDSLAFFAVSLSAS